MRTLYPTLPAILVLGVSLSPVALRAQSCFRGQPLPTCRSFWLTELGYTYKLNAEAANHHYVTLDLGYMSNRSERVALGGTLLVGYEDDFRLALQPRVRHWLSRSTSLEVSPGILLVGGEGNAPGFTGSVAFNVRDQVILTSRMELVDRGPFEENAAWYAGVKLGSKPGVVASIVGSAATLVLFVAYVIHCSSQSCD